MRFITSIISLQEARALLGKLEYQRGNVESALRVFEGIDLQAAIERFQPSGLDKQATKKDRPDSVHAVPQHAANVVLEAMYLKAKSLQKLARLIGQETSKFIIKTIHLTPSNVLLPLCPHILSTSNQKNLV